ncbi:MAG: hypothetical protein LBD82_05255 [Deltaproteobacteria bacterium]|jgi:hypothetical protein|nr:hypothetical protein [Deltaproteobacteria bacterium]
MRAAQLLTDLKAFVERAMRDFELPGSAVPHGPPSVFLGGLPTTGTENLPDRFPFVLILWDNGSDQENETNESVDETSLVIGLHTPPGANGPDAEEAELLCAAVMDHLRLALMRHRLLGGRFELELPLTSAKPDPGKKQHLYHLMTVSAKWRYALPQRLMRDIPPGRGSGLKTPQEPDYD